MTRLVQALRARRRLAASSLIALYSAVLVGAGVHEAIEAHQVCEHGALVHTDAAPASGLELSAHEGLDTNAGDDHDDGHAHCDVDVRSEELGLPTVAPTLAASLSTSPLVLTGLREAAAVSSVSVLSDAPKQSPPARG